MWVFSLSNAHYVYIWDWVVDKEGKRHKRGAVERSISNLIFLLKVRLYFTAIFQFWGLFFRISQDLSDYSRVHHHSVLNVNVWNVTTALFWLVKHPSLLSLWQETRFHSLHQHCTVACPTLWAAPLTSEPEDVPCHKPLRHSRLLL